jgi:hypothetical protein
MVLPSRVEERVGVIDEAEQHGDRLFQEVTLPGILRSGHPKLLWSGVGRMTLFLHSPIHATLI